ncbi:MAG: ABC transporter ATP-binding protein [Nitrospina sp.]|jgi:ABC-type branched-subunit amino acid transport system ATPase component|nr:ABC transporter ATP-binding protein [Nitrospina sp.]
MNLLKVDKVHSGYERTEILHGVSLYVDSGEVVTIIGPNGCGKSTLLKTIMGHLRPQQGGISFRDEDISASRPDQKLKKGIGYVPQLKNIFPNLSVLENLEMGGYILGRRDMGRALERIYEIFPKLKERTNQTAGTLSGGERQMVAMGSALMTSPSLMLLDEPSAGLSPVVAIDIFKKIKELNQEGTSILIVEQNAYESLEISNRGYVLAIGKNEFDGNAQEILQNERIREAYLGG